MPRPVARCGTIAGYQAHHYRGEEACPVCKQAHRVYQAEYARARRDSRAVRIPQQRVPMPDFDEPICANDPELWFPKKGESALQPKKLCRACPYVRPCGDYALKHYVQGVWGAMSEQDRRRIQRRQGIQPIAVAGLQAR